MLFSRHFDNWRGAKGEFFDRINKIYKIRGSEFPLFSDKLRL